MVKDIRQGNEDQAGTAVRLHTVGKAGGENDQSGAQSHQRVQRRHPGRLAHQCALLADIAAKDGHSADAQTQGKERLVHGPGHHIANAHFLHPRQIRHQVKAQPLAAPGGAHTVDGQHHHNDQQCHHHPLGNALQPLLQAKGAHQEAQHDDNAHKQGHA